MLKYRLIFGALMTGLVVGLVWLDTHLSRADPAGLWLGWLPGARHAPPGSVLALLFITIIPLAARELARMFQSVGLAGHTLLISLASIAGCLAVYATPEVFRAPTGVAIIATVLVAAFLITLVWHSRDANTHGVIAAAGGTMFAIALLGLMPGFFLAIRRSHSAWVVVAIILITKSGDIGAYFTGRALGRHKLIPWLSPKKTWEGLAGGVVLAAAVAMGFAWLSQNTDLTGVFRIIDGRRAWTQVHYHVGLAAIAGALFAIVGHAGDLMISLLKRDAGVKDSGASIPGFGGLLDVIDSPLLVAPFAYWMLALAERL